MATMPGKKRMNIVGHFSPQANSSLMSSTYVKIKELLRVGREKQEFYVKPIENLSQIVVVMRSPYGSD